MPVHPKPVGNGKFMLAEPSGALSSHRKNPGDKGTVSAQARVINAAISKKEASDYMALVLPSTAVPKLAAVKPLVSQALEQKLAALYKAAVGGPPVGQPAASKPVSASIQPPKPPAPPQMVPPGATLGQAPLSPASGLARPAVPPAAAPAAAGAPGAAAQGQPAAPPAQPPMPAPATSTAPGATPPAQQSSAPPAQASVPAAVPGPG